MTQKNLLRAVKEERNTSRADSLKIISAPLNCAKKIFARCISGKREAPPGKARGILDDPEKHLIPEKKLDLPAQSRYMFRV